MTVATAVNRWEYTGDGAQTAFQYTNRVFAGGDLKVFIDNVLKTLTTDYTVSNAGSVSGGNVTFAVAPAASSAVVILRDLAITQTTDYVENGPQPAEVQEDTLDRLTMIAQQLDDAVIRSIRQPQGEKLAAMELPAVASRASQYMGFDGLGVPAVLGPPTGTSITTAWSQTLLDDANSAAARKTMGLEGIASLTDFAGVDPTNSGDSAAGVQLAVDSGAAILLIPPGTYQINSAVNITSPIRIIGPGLKRIAGDPQIAQFVTSSDTANIIEINADYVIVDGIHINGLGSRTALNKGSGIAVGTVTRTVTDGAITALSTTFTSATAAFTAADVNVKINIAGAYSGTSTPNIVSVTNATTIEVSIAADNTVAAATTQIAKVIKGVVIRNVSAASHFAGVDFQNASNWLVDACDLNGWYGMRIGANAVATDKGDMTLSNSHISAALAAGRRCIEWNANGSLKIDTCKFLDCETGINVNWNRGTSGGPNINNCSFENFSASAFAAGGDSTQRLTGVTITGNWIAGGTAPIAIADNIPLTHLNIVGNTINSASSTELIRIGALVSKFLIEGNILDGNNVAGAGGVAIKSGALNGRVGPNFYTGLAIEVGNASASVTVGVWSGLRLLNGTAVFDFPSIPSTGESSSTMTVTGAQVGDKVMLGVPVGSALNGLLYDAFVSAANTVTVRVNNYSTIAIDPPSGTFNATVLGG